MKAKTLNNGSSRKSKKGKEIINKILQENFPKLKDIDFQTERSYQVPAK